MKRSILLGALLLAACGPDPEVDPAAGETATEDSAALEAITRPAAIDAAQKGVDQAEKDMAERARQAQEQVRQAEGATSTSP
jgi:hypothetical protein